MSLHPDLICLSQTKHSEFARDAFRNGRKIDLLANKAFLLNAFLTQSHDPELAKTVIARWNHFMKFLRNFKLDLVEFNIAKSGDDYLITYTIQSKIHRTPAFKVDRGVRGDIAYNFVPTYFVSWLDGLMNDVPYDELITVASGG